jgi:hypothetical protein
MLPPAVRLAAQDHAGRLQPVLGEGRLHVLDDRPLHAHVGVAPVIGGAPVAHPLAADAGPAREADAAVHDEDATVIALVVTADDVLAQRPEPREVAARHPHEVEVLGGNGQRAERVEEDVDADAGATALGHRLRDVASHRPFLVVVLRVGDRALGRADAGQHRREDVLTVQQDLGGVAADDRRAGVRLQRGEERRLAQHQRRQRDVRLHAGAARRGGQAQDGDEGDDETDRAHERPRSGRGGRRNVQREASGPPGIDGPWFARV